MIGPGTDARVMVATKPVDFRKGADSLAALVKAEYGATRFQASCTSFAPSVRTG